MRGSRAVTAVAATGLAAALALGSVAPASASTAGTAAVRQSVVATSAAKTPFPGKKPAAILAVSVKTAKASSGYHVKVSAVEGSGVNKIDLIIGKLGARGTITDSTGTLHLIRVKQTVYLNGDAKYWAANGMTGAQAKAVAGKWIGLKGGPGAKEMLQLTTLSYWPSQVGTLKPTARVGGKAVAKLPTVGLKAADATIYVAAKGKPYPLLVTDPADARNTMTFTEWNKKVTFKAPKAIMVISI